MKRPQRYLLLGKDQAFDAGVRAACHSFIERLPQDKAWRVEIHQHREARTPRQRRALFGVAYKALMDHMGLYGAKEKEILHRWVCGQVYGTKQDALGRTVPIRTTTTDENGEPNEITTDEANEFYAFIQRLAAEHGIDVPDPDPAMRSQL